MNVWGLCTNDSDLDVLRLVHAAFPLKGIIGLAPGPSEDEPQGCRRPLPSASELGLQYIEAKSDCLSEPADKAALNALDIDVLFIVGWPGRVPAWLIDQCRIGCVGAHGNASGIATGRGRSAPSWAFILGERSFTISLFLMEPDADTGPVIATREVPIEATDDVGSTDVKRGLLIAEMMIDSLKDGAIRERRALPQLTPAYELPDRSPRDGAIDWRRSTGEICDFVRGLTRPCPGAFVRLQDYKLTIWRARRLQIRCGSLNGAPGEIAAVLASGALVVRAGDGWVLAEDIEVTPEDPGGLIRPGIVLPSVSFVGQMREIIARHETKYPDRPLHPRLRELGRSESLGVVVPAFNESEAVVPMVKGLRVALRGRDIAYKLVLVDDGSTDETAQRFSELAGEDPDRTVIVTHATNRGLGQAIISGYQVANTDWVGWLPADGQFLPSDLLALFAARTGNDASVGHVALANRTKADNIVRVILSKGLRILMRTLHPHMPPFNGIMVIRRDRVVPEHLVCRTGFVNMEILDRLRRQHPGGRIGERSVQVYPRTSGSSKVANVKTTLLVVRDLVRLRWDYLIRTPAARHVAAKTA